MTHKIDRSNYLKLSEDGFAMDLKLTHLQRHDFNPLGRPRLIILIVYEWIILTNFHFWSSKE